MISIFSLTLAANESREVAITGEYFELRNAEYPVALIELMDRSGGIISRLENPEQSDFVRPGPFETVRITNGATPQTVKHFYGTGDAGSRRTSGQVQVLGTVGVSGTVSVVDGGKARTIAGQAFATYIGMGAIAGQYSRIQLFNPVGSGKSVILKAYKVTASAATTCFVHQFNSPLLSGGTMLNSKMPGGLPPIAQSRYESNAALLAVTRPIDYLNFTGIGTNAFVMQEPIVIPSGWGVILENATQNQRLDASFEWIEE